MYYDAGLLHRDISTGNILICPNFQSAEKKVVGRLIDLEMSKITDTFSPSLLNRLKDEKSHHLLKSYSPEVTGKDFADPIIAVMGHLDLPVKNYIKNF